jgi:hypothetical protein
MPAEGIPPTLAYALRDPNSGALVVPDLYHLHESTWTVRALLPGYPGSTTLGDFTIKLPAPYSEEFKAHASQYKAILSAANAGIGLKVEGYQGSVNAGAPVLSGVITKMNLPLDGPWELTGSDTLYWLQQSQLLPGESMFAQDAIDYMVHFFGTREVLWGDDFSNWSGASSPGRPASADYTQTPGSSWNITTDPLFALPAVHTTSSPAVLTTTTGWSNGQYAVTGFGAAEITVHAVLALGTSTTDSGNVGILLLSDASGQNALFVQAQTVQIGTTGLYNVNVNIWTVAGGAFTAVASASNVLTNLTSPTVIELTAILEVTADSASTTTNTLRLLVNGKDPNITYSGWFPPGVGSRIGVRYAYNAGGAPAAYINRLTFESRTSQQFAALGGWGTDRFQPGNIQLAPLGTTLPVITGQGQSHLDVITQAAGSIGYLVRKNPGAGAKADTLDVAPSPGTDLSIVFEERDNVVAQNSAFQNVAEVYSTDITLKSPPNASGDSGGSVDWKRIGVPGDMVLTDTVSDVGTLGYTLLASYARAIQARKAAPLAATQLAVARTADLVKANGGWGPRELDTVLLNLPTYGVNKVRAQIVGYAVAEGQAVQVFYLTQFPDAKLPHAGLQRLIRSVDYLATTFQSR